jgi:sortase A
MNQILISEKVYITPELKKKKRMYKIDFFISVFLVFILSSYYIYAEYDKNKGEQKAQEILASLSFNNSLVDDTVIKFEDNATLVILNEEQEDTNSKITILSTASLLDSEENTSDGEVDEDTVAANIRNSTQTTDNGTKYYPIALINIPSINCQYSILSGLNTEYTWSDELLKISPCYFWGAEPNEVGNFCIVGHNYRNTKFFSKVPNLENGDIIEITDLVKTKTTVQYYVYDKYTVVPDDRDCTSQETDGKTEITLITCTNDGKKRVIIKARKVGE